MGRPKRIPPRDAVANWPNSRASSIEVEVIRLLALNLDKAIGGRSAREIGRLTGVDYTSVIDIIDGGRFPELSTLIRLEAGLGVDLWPAGIAANFKQD